VDGHVALGRDAAHRRHVRARHVAIAARVVEPDRRAGSGVEAADRHALRREHPERGVDAIAFDQHAGSDGPAGDHLLVADQSAVGDVRAILPYESPGVRGDAVREPVVGTEQDVDAVELRGKADRCVGREPPPLKSGVKVQSVQRVVRRRGIVDGIRVGRDGIGVVEVDPLRLPDRLAPRGSRLVFRGMDPDGAVGRLQVARRVAGALEITEWDAVKGIGL